MAFFSRRFWFWAECFGCLVHPALPRRSPRLVSLPPPENRRLQVLQPKHPRPPVPPTPSNVRSSKRFPRSMAIGRHPFLHTSHPLAPASLGPKRARRLGS